MLKRKDNSALEEALQELEKSSSNLEKNVGLAKQGLATTIRVRKRRLQNHFGPSMTAAFSAERRY